MRTPLQIGFTSAVIVAMMAAVAPAAPKALVDVRATIRGEVLAEGLAKPGDDVNEGTALVYVKTQTGRAVAARATVDGRVVEVLVNPGSIIRELGAVVVRLDPK
jgi:biotin carboxyl carrier protein